MIDRLLDTITFASWTAVGLTLIAGPFLIASLL
jgi:hypothetical protein